MIIYPHISSSLTLEASNTGINALLNTAFDALNRSFYTYLIVGSAVIINIGLTIMIAERLTRPSPYYELSDKTGLASSERPPKRPSGSKGLSFAGIPLQSSENNDKRRARRGYKAYRKLHDKEL